MRMFKTILTSLVALTITTIAVAETAPEDEARYRQSIMKALSGHNGAIRMIVAGRAGDASKLSSHAQALAALADEVESIFPPGSDLADDETLPAIWEDPEGFSAAVAELLAAADELAHVASGGDLAATNAAHRQLGQACKGCHEQYRVDD